MMKIKLVWILSLLGSSLLTLAQSPAVRNGLRVKGVLKEDSPIYAQPSNSSDETGSAKRFSPVFIFIPENNGTNLVKDGFYQVGKEPNSAIGWLPANVVAEWDHRLCLNFTPLVGRQPALVYESKDKANTALVAGVADRQKAVAEEPGDTSGNRYSMLLPVLEKQKVTTGGQIKQAYRIGFLSGNEQPTSLSSNGPAPSDSSSAKELALLEVVFVMDATGSMQPYIDGAKQVIQSISQSVRGMREAGTRFGLVCYRDYIDNQSAMEYVVKRYAPLDRNLSNTLEILNHQVRKASVSSEDYPEAMFDGLYAAITETNWNKDKSSLRIVVLVGDASAHPSGDRKNPHNYSLSQMTKTAQDNRVRIIAIKIRSGEDDDEIHREQMQKLAQGESAEVGGVFEEIDGSANVGDYIQALTAKIETEIGRMGTLVQAVHDPTIVQALPSDEKAIILNNLKTTGGTGADFREGWISERSPEGKLQVKPYVFFPFDDMALSIFYLQTALTLAKSSTDKIQRTLAQTVNTQTGEKWEEGETLETHYKKKLGLPATSNLLRFSLKDIATWGEQRRKDLAESLKGKIKLLETHRDDAGNWYKLGGDFRYTFVPLEFLP